MKERFFSAEEILKLIFGNDYKPVCNWGGGLYMTEAMAHGIAKRIRDEAIIG